MAAFDGAFGEGSTLGIDEATMEVRAVKSSPALAPGPREPLDGSHVGDGEGKRHRSERSPNVLPDPIGQIPADAQTGSAMADGAYDTRRCHGPKQSRPGEVFVPIPLATSDPRPPPQPRRGEDALHEPKVGAAKLLGQRFLARDLDRQVAELQIRIAVLKRHTAFGIPVTKPAG